MVFVRYLKGTDSLIIICQVQEIPGMIYNCTGTKFKDTCKVKCHEHFVQTMPNIQCGSDGTWSNLSGGESFLLTVLTAL